MNVADKTRYSKWSPNVSPKRNLTSQITHLMLRCVCVFTSLFCFSILTGAISVLYESYFESNESKCLQFHFIQYLGSKIYIQKNMHLLSGTLTTVCHGALCFMSGCKFPTHQCNPVR